MKKIEAIIRPEKLDVVIDRLETIGISGMNIFEVKGYGNQKGHIETYRGVSYSVRLRKKVRIELVVSEDIAENVINTIIEAARTGREGDGKIFITNIKDAVKIRTGDRGTDAL